ncbi:OLC1v1014780C1 [Oldenlandia corymbosa var. corymbosa]|uniref:OLC1v1014780C1 n=1 Tax=Oldenlandia corymbosa var. corymbosa TaxID=529605 RepID=A0AAV1E483_OLDCO|nr:OLC1v1014780C1 [Oldenlandia corymbosa var. corymbosa]
MINILCSHLELFRTTKAKIKTQHAGLLTIDEMDKELKYVLYTENKLHPSLFSAEAEHKVLQRLMDGLMSLTFRPKDLQCSLFFYVVRELLACVVMRPVLNLATPRFINERIESLVISLSKTEKGTAAAESSSHPKQNGSTKTSPDHISHFLDPSSKGVELVQLKKDQVTESDQKRGTENMNGSIAAKDPLLSMDARSTRSWSALPSDSQTGEGKGIQRHRSGGEWGEMLDAFSRRKTEALAPEHFENMWTKGRNYKRKDDTNPSSDQARDQSKKSLKQKEDVEHKVSGVNKGIVANISSSQSESHHSRREEYDNYLMDSDEVESVSSSSYTTDDEENNAVTGLDSPGVRVWDAKSRRNVAKFHHPLETRKVRKKNRHSQKLTKTLSGRKRSGSVNENAHVWQEVQRTSFLLGDGQDILNSSVGDRKHDDLSDDSGGDKFARISSGSNASSFMSSTSLPESYMSAIPTKTSIIAEAFLTLRCEVSGANIVKSGSKNFAVYSISVTDVNNHSWSIKRRFRHFEELHRHLKEFPEYNLHLPPKHFLSTGLDITVIRERCKLLDTYLKKLMQLPSVSSSIEVWDFLSVDSQTYIFSNPLSIIETISVNSDDTKHETNKEYRTNVGSAKYPVYSGKANPNVEFKEPALQKKHNSVLEGSKISRNAAVSAQNKPVEVGRKPLEDSSSDSDGAMQKILTSTKNLGKTSDMREAGSHSSLPTDAASDPTLPSEWVPPNLSLPIFNLVDVVFQLQDGGWIRSKAFWVAKQVLHLGMGDAFDDWLIEKIQLLRRGSVVAAGIRRLEQILWPDGIFITKHPRRQKANLSVSPSQNSSHSQTPSPLSSPKIENVQMTDDSQEREALRRAKLVYDLMIGNAILLATVVFSPGIFVDNLMYAS